MATTVKGHKTPKIREETQAINFAKPKLMSSKPKTRFIQNVAPKQPQLYIGVPKMPVFSIDKIAKNNMHS